MSEETDNKTKVTEAISKAGKFETTPDSVKELKLLLKNPVLQTALHEVLVEADACAFVLLSLDLGTPEGNARGQQQQGYARGLTRAVEALLDLAYDTETEGN